jgi:hypothetical protein
MLIGFNAPRDFLRDGDTCHLSRLDAELLAHLGSKLDHQWVRFFLNSGRGRLLGCIFFAAASEQEDQTAEGERCNAAGVNSGHDGVVGM